jgi:hypothetical protein
MKHTALVQRLSVALVVVFLSVPWGQAAFAAKLVNTGTFGSTAIKGYDPVSYFIEGKPAKGSKTFTHQWNGAAWRFSSAGNRDLFAATPEKYAPQYGGWCAYAMAEGKKVKIDPRAWDIVDGKLYLNYSLSIQKKWLADRDQKIIKADAHWMKITADAKK